MSTLATANLPDTQEPSQPSSGALLKLQNVSLKIGGQQVLQSICFEVPCGQFVGIAGPNGGGKTSLLRVVLGLLVPTTGRVLWQHQHVRKGYVPQRISIDNNHLLSCVEIVTQGFPGPLPHGAGKSKQLRETARQRLQEVGLEPEADKPYAHLSGGQQQRALLARALMVSPELLVLDEPTSCLDSEGTGKFCALIKSLTRSGVTVIMVSHDIPLLLRMADRIACLSQKLHWHESSERVQKRLSVLTHSCEMASFQTLIRLENLLPGLTPPADKE